MMSKIPKPGSGLPPPTKRKSFGLPGSNNIPSDRESVSSDASSENRRFSGTLSSDRISPSPPPPGPLNAINKRLSGSTSLRKPSLSKPTSANSSPILASGDKPPLIPSKPLGPKPTSKIPTLSNVSSPASGALSEHNGSALLSPKRLSVLKQHPPRPTSPAVLGQFQVGDRVSVESMGISGTLRFLGPTKFKPGTWAGIELDVEGTGKNDGIVDGIVYFTCLPKTGLFVLGHKLTKVRVNDSPEKEESKNEETLEVSKDTTASVSKRRGIPLPGAISSSATPSKSSLLLLSPTNPVPNVTGARASRYIGMTAAQLKKVNSSPAPPISPSPATSTSDDQLDSNRQPLPTLKSFQANSFIKSPPSYSAPSPSPSSSPSPSPTSPKGPLTPSRSNSPVHSGILGPRSEMVDESMTIQDFKSSPSNELLSLEQANSKIQQLQQQIERLERENSKLQAEKQPHVESSNRIYEEHSPSQIDQLKLEFNELKSLQDQWEVQKFEQSKKILHLEEKLLEYQRQLDVAKSEAARLLLESENRFKSEISTITETLTKQLDMKAAQMSELQDTINHINVELESKAMVESDLREKLSLAEAQREGDAMNQDLIASLQTELENKSIEVGKLTARLDRTKSDFEKEKAQLVETISRVQQEEMEKVQVYKEQLAAVEQEDIAALKSQLMDFERIIKDQEQMISQLRSAGSEAFDHYERELQSIKDENHSLQEQIKNIVDAGRQLESEADGLKLELEKAKIREEELVSETNALQEIVDNYQVTSSKRKEEIQKLKTEVEKLTAIQAEDGEHNTQEKSKLLADLQELRSKLDALEEEKEQSSEKQRDLTLKLTSMEEELDRIKHSYEELLSSQENWASEKSELEAEVSNIRNLLNKDTEAAKRAIDSPEIIELTDTIKDLHAMVEEDSSQLEAVIEEKDSHILKLNSELEVLRSQLAVFETPRASSNEHQSFEELKSVHEQSLAQQTRLQADYSALMEAQANLLEAHKQMEAECLKLMDEVERLHNESLEGDMATPATEEMIEDQVELNETKSEGVEVNRLRGVLTEKQTVINQMKQQYRDDIRQLQKRMTDLEITKQKEIEMQSKDIAELESIVEHKIFREAELEEQIAELKKKVDQLDTNSGDNSSKGEDERPDQKPGKSSKAKFSSLSAALTDDEDAELYCELCDSVGHDILSCTAYPIDMDGYNGYDGDDRTYCDNCEEFDLHWTDECPNQDETF